MYMIQDNLATHALGEETYQLSKERLQTGKVLEGTDFVILDCRDLKDEWNPPELYEKKLKEASSIIQKHGKIVVCCGAGQSRSPAIALGILAGYYGMDFYDAWSLVRTKVPIAQIEPAHFASLKDLLKVGRP